MAESEKTNKVFFDAPTKGLFLLTGGFAALVVGLAIRAWATLPQRPTPKVVPSTRRLPTPTPAPENALTLFDDNTLRKRGWPIQHSHLETGESTELLAPSGAIFEQKLLPLREGLSPRAIATRIDTRLSRWGQEYQQVRLGSVERGGLKMTRLEYALNLPGRPTQRTVTIVGRVRINGERRVALWTLAAPEEKFSQEKSALAEIGIRL
jgi:hypothetical protein